MIDRFAEMMEADGFEAWWACEEKWDEYEDQLLKEGFDKEMVEDFFTEMAWDI